MSLTPRQFHDFLDALYEQLEQLFDDSELDLDVDNNGSLLTITFDNDSQAILSRQEPLRQLWLAIRSGGLHFDYQADTQRWYCTSTRQYLDAALQQEVLAQTGNQQEFPEL